MAAINALKVVWHGADVASYCAVMACCPRRSVLRLPNATLLIGLCETVREHRLRALYSPAPVQALRVLSCSGHEASFVEVRDENTASIGGIVTGGAFIDVKAVFGTHALQSAGFRVWRL